MATQVNVVNLGNAQMLTIPGEALPNIGYYLKRNMPAEHTLLLGLTNDAFGYILTKVDWNSFERYNYITRTCLGEMTGEIFMREGPGLRRRLPPPGPAGQDRLSAINEAFPFPCPHGKGQPPRPPRDAEEGYVSKDVSRRDAGTQGLR